MCLILTALAAVVAGVFWYLKDRQNVRKSGVLALMYAGAALMWLIDCSIAAITEGEAFLDLSADDAMLGALIIVSGFVVYLGILFFGKISAKNNLQRA